MREREYINTTECATLLIIRDMMDRNLPTLSKVVPRAKWDEIRTQFQLWISELSREIIIDDEPKSS